MTDINSKKKKIFGRIPKFNFNDGRANTELFGLFGSTQIYSKMSIGCTLHDSILDNSIAKKHRKNTEINLKLKQTGPKYQLTENDYKWITNNKDYLLLNQTTPVNKLKINLNEAERIPCIFVTPNENKNKSHLMIYFHANGEDLMTSHVFLKHLADAMYTSVVSPEYPGYSLYESNSQNEKTVIENSENLIAFVTEILGFETKNIMIIGLIIRPITWLFVCVACCETFQVPLPCFNIAFFLVSRFSAKHVWRDCKANRKGFI